MSALKPEGLWFSLLTGGAWMQAAFAAPTKQHFKRKSHHAKRFQKRLAEELVDTLPGFSHSSSQLFLAVEFLHVQFDAGSRIITNALRNRVPFSPQHLSQPSCHDSYVL